MNISDSEFDQVKPLTAQTKKRILRLSLLVLGVGTLVCALFLLTRPKPPKQQPVRIAPLVETMSVQAETQTVVIKALGTVVPAQETTIRAEVPGTVREMSTNFLSGKILSQGSLLLRLNPEDFQLDVAAKEAAFHSAQADLELELGRQNVARHDWTLVTGARNATAPALALRKPQLLQAQAAVQQAKAALEQARLNLKRATVTVPYTALILEKNVDLGARVSITDTLATLVDARQYWVEAAIAVDQLPWIALPDKNKPGSLAHIRSQASSATRDGRILCLRGDLEKEGRLAQVLVSLPKPLEAKPTPILLGEYVRLEIEGRKLDNVIRLPRVALRDNDTVWVVQNATLDIRPVMVAWRDVESVLVSAGLRSGETVVTSDLSTPIQNMPVTTNQMKN